MKHSQLWALEADRRYQDILDGKARTIAGEEVIASIDAMLMARRDGSPPDVPERPHPAGVARRRPAPTPRKPRR
jgi:Putative addiction module component